MSNADTETTIEETSGGLPALMGNHSLAVSLARVEIDQQIATSRAFGRSIQRAVSQITTLATLDEETAAECIYALPRGGKTIRGPSIRFAEIMASQWGNCRVGARVVHVDKIEAYVEAEGVFHDLETNVVQTARVRRTIQAKRGKGIDNDMISLAGAAACSIARRNAILAGIPKGVARKGYMAVEDVIRGDSKTLVERRGMALKAFMVLGVTPDRIFASLGVIGEDDITLDHLMTLTGARSAIKNGELTVEEAFPVAAPSGPKQTLSDRLDTLAKDPEHDKETGEIKETPAGDAQPAGEAQRSDHVAGHQPAAAQASASPKASGDEPGTAGGNLPPSGDGAAAVQSSQAPAAAPEHHAPLPMGPAPAEPKQAEPDPLAELVKAGDAAAKQGKAALDHFLGSLDPDQEAMLTPAQQKLWKQTAAAAAKRS
jgi:hypothetical protein